MRAPAPSTNYDSTIAKEPPARVHPYPESHRFPSSLDFLSFLRISFPFPPKAAIAKFNAAMDNYGNFMAIANGRKEAEKTESRAKKC